MNARRETMEKELAVVRDHPTLILTPYQAGYLAGVRRWPAGSPYPLGSGDWSMFRLGYQDGVMDRDPAPPKDRPAAAP